MKKLALLLAVIMLFGLFILPVSAHCDIDRNKFECNNDIIYFRKRFSVQASEIIEQSGDSSAVVLDCNGNILESQAIVPTGSFLATMHNGAVADKVQICLMEDVSCDGKVTARDARLALRYSAKLEKLEGLSLIAADVDENGKISAADARLILRKAAKL